MTKHMLNWNLIDLFVVMNLYTTVSIILGFKYSNTSITKGYINILIISLVTLLILAYLVFCVIRITFCYIYVKIL